MSYVPSNLYYSEEHEWVRSDHKHVSIGISDFAQSELGDIVFVELPEVGTLIKAGEIFGTVESVKTVSDLFAPVSGKIVEVNNKLEDNPELVNSDPYNDGYMVVVELDDTSDFEGLMDAEAYKIAIK